jgi:hypothetical protein
LPRQHSHLAAADQEKVASRSGKEFIDDLASEIGQSNIQPIEAYIQFQVIEAEQM